MKRMTLAGGLLAALATPTLNPVWADGMFWVVGSNATDKCEIVTSNPVVDGGNIWFVDGPYKSRDDAKLARSTINACPKVDPGKDEADAK
jgi:hypothetical protein